MIIVMKYFFHISINLFTKKFDFNSRFVGGLTTGNPVSLFSSLVVLVKGQIAL